MEQCLWKEYSILDWIDIGDGYIEIDKLRNSKEKGGPAKSKSLYGNIV